MYIHPQQPKIQTDKNYHKKYKILIENTIKTHNNYMENIIS